jgi:hypothetical protein
MKAVGVVEEERQGYNEDSREKKSRLDLKPSCPSYLPV